ncbi:Ferrous-iron efflux pump FieF [Kluyvera cryocrescens]|uniref:Ferrous-iron efflux pump FieF n=1 Tax=Kluyvera cryocrescens TaxID=580 RepID=A0A485B511_KLUCR|nr:Ferrous-iron efflux pump FieF [Kluyvera cryocrescens]
MTCLWFRRITLLTRFEQAILHRFPGSDVIIHQDPCSVVPQGNRGI